jgi:phage-related tail fiber protein
VNVLGISNNDNGSVDIDWLTVSNEIITSTSKLKSGATANQTWTLPNETGTLATKEYVNILAQGLHIHASVHVILKTSLESLGAGTVTYTNGTAGVGAKLTLQNPLTQAMLDGDPDALTVGARIIVAGQSNQAINGIYTYSTSTELIRATDFDEPAEVAGGDFVFVTHGTIGANTGWVLSEKVTSISSTGSPFIFQQFSGVGTFTAGNGLTLVGGTDFNVNSTTLTVGADAVDLASGIATAGTYQSVTVDTYGRVTAGTNPTTVTYTAGNGLTLADGTDFNVNSTGAGSLTVGADTINLTSGIATAGTYKSVTVDTYGRVTAGTNPTTLAGYGITDAVNAVATIVPISAATEFISTDNAKIFHVSGTTTLTLPSAGSILDGWSIGIVNVGGAPLTVNRSSTDTINGALTTFSNTVPYSAFYIYKSSSSTFVAIGILY